MMVTRQEDDRTELLRTVGPFLTLGIELAAVVVLFYFLGRWLDARFGTSPWLMIGSLTAGVTVGLYQFIRTVTLLSKRPPGAEDVRHERHS